VSLRVKKGTVIVVTDIEYGATFTGDPNLILDDDVVLITVRDDATMEERIEMAAKAADIVRARSGEPAS